MNAERTLGQFMLGAEQSCEVRLSPLRVCSDLYFNALTGSVPSSLSTLTNLRDLCVAPCAARIFARASASAPIGRLCCERGSAVEGACRRIQRMVLQWACYGTHWGTLLYFRLLEGY